MDCSTPGYSVPAAVPIGKTFAKFGNARVRLVAVPTNAGDIRDMGSIPGLGKSPRGGHGNPLQYSCLENTGEPGRLESLGL